MDNASEDVEARSSCSSWEARIVMQAHMMLREGLEVRCKHCGGWHVLARNAADAQRKTAESDFLYFTDQGRTYYGGTVGMPSIHPVREP